MQDFRITRIGENIYHILDSGDSSFYVVEGSERAAVIDLVDQVVRRKIAGCASYVGKTLTMEPALYASFGCAELQYGSQNIR